MSSKFPALHDRCQWCSIRLEHGTRAFSEQLCDACRTPERIAMLKQLKRERQRAWRAKAKCNLTLRAWATTVEHYKGLCAYCGKREYRVIEHVLPIALGGGTTVDNCVPACEECNQRKGHRHPDTLTGARMDGIRAYLAGRAWK